MVHVTFSRSGGIYSSSQYKVNVPLHLTIIPMGEMIGLHTVLMNVIAGSLPLSISQCGSCCYWNKRPRLSYRLMFNVLFMFSAKQRRVKRWFFQRTNSAFFFASRGLKSPATAKELQKEGLKCSRIGIYKVLKKYEVTGLIWRQVGSGHPSKITAEIKERVERQMRTDDETTAYQLHRLLMEKGYSISLRMTLCCRTALG